MFHVKINRLVSLGAALAIGLLLSLGVSWVQAATPAEKNGVVKPIVPSSKPAGSVTITTALPPPQPVTAVPNKVKVGIYLTQLYDIDMAKRSFNATFWGWYQTTDGKYKPVDNVEVVNAKASSTKFSAVIPYNNIPWDGGNADVFWMQAKYNALLIQDWNIDSFPFDRQVLRISLEDSVNDESQTIFVADAENSKIDKEVRLPGWNIESFSIKSIDSVYDTTYGDPTLHGDSTYSRIVADITIKRAGLRILCSMFIGFFVAFTLVLLSYFMDAVGMAASRVGLSAGAIFAAIGNKYIIDNYLPPSSSFTLADGIELATFLAIIFGILVTVVIQWFKAHHPRTVRRINHYAAAFSVVAYAGFIGHLVNRAVSG
ncbi:MAG: hypothetical protein P4M00_09915 [Azospirillaceae bacterium]|nr:hypothetical protein [Azospirillaceae bacterium]